MLVVIVVSLVAAIPISLLIVEVTSRIDRRIRKEDHRGRSPRQ